MAIYHPQIIDQKVVEFPQIINPQIYMFLLSGLVNLNIIIADIINKFISQHLTAFSIIKTLQVPFITKLFNNSNMKTQFFYNNFMNVMK